MDNLIWLGILSGSVAVVSFGGAVRETIIMIFKHGL